MNANLQIDAKGEVKHCSRSENAELFRLAVGGYGLFGFVYSVTLRLVPRRKVERVVEVREIEGDFDKGGARHLDFLIYFANFGAVFRR